jgi:hypothetical protein
VLYSCLFMKNKSGLKKYLKNEKNRVVLKKWLYKKKIL